MSRPVHTLLNIGPRTAEWLVAVGLPDEASLRAVGTEEAWRRLKARFPRQVSLNAAYGIEAALLEVPWQVLSEARKAELREALR